ncbi:hypothetical protein GCM10010441_29010 [Kitasatospora paracochleata]|uniref:PKD domain-containing protein n=1 Tax=Kitasatospora paracochleata TaxID=58354 RepID=A0ABT1IZM9_9ACTN|nr:PKD domain-containing protein [Kitasatospora paracochleata]MCP2310378.1 hypothetical protein [Kitasatospora paracochleata]
MRLRQSAALTVAAVTAVLGLPGLATADQAGTTLVVDGSAANCSDSGSGSYAQPYCKISAAAAAVQPGQTVLVLPGTYPDDPVTLTRSGTPEQPITFLGGPVTYDKMAQPMVRTTGTAVTNGFALVGVHDVVIRGFTHYGLRDPLTVTDSARITLDQNRFEGRHSLAAVRISGKSDHVTVSRSLFLSSGGVVVEPGSHDTLITANDLNRTANSAVSVKDAPGTAVTDNTIVYSCLESVLIDGASPGAVVENNVITADNPAHTHYNPAPCDAAHRGEAEISVSADSTPGSKVDYNTVHPWPDAAGYRWAGTAYPTAAALKAATGQGAHDVDLNIDIDENRTWPFDVLSDADTAAIDSADPTAPGVDTDFFGSKPVDHPKVGNTAPGGGLRDRGAFERTGLHDAGLQVHGAGQANYPTGPVPLTVRAVASVTEDWGSPVQYSFDFGDGTAPVVSTSPEVTHTYTRTGSFPVIVTVTDALGARTVGNTSGAHANPPGDLVPQLTTTQLDGGGLYKFQPTGTSPWTVFGETVDFGDGSAPQHPTYGEIYHRYETPGTYTVKETVSDDGGREAVKTVQLRVDYDAEHAALLPGRRVQVIARTADSLLDTGANLDRGVWAGFTPVASNGSNAPAPAQVQSVATTTTGDEYLRTFAVVDGRILSVDRNLGGTRPGGMGYVDRGFWFDWAEVTGAAGAGDLPGVTQVAAASIGEQTHVVALANGRVYEASGNHNTGKWSRWGDITAAVGLPGGVTSIAAGTTGNSLHVATLGADKHVRVADGNYDRGTWSAGDVTAAYGGPTGITQLAGASTPGSRFHVVVLAGGSVHETTGDYAAGYWTGWGNISAASGLTGFSQVAAASTDNSLRLFGVSGGHVYNANGDYTRGQWSSWLDVTAPGAAGTPAKPITAVAAGGIG